MKKAFESYEYIFSAVPSERRKATLGLICIMAGFSFSPSSLTLGMGLGRSMAFTEAAVACLAGNLLLFAVALFWGLLAWSSGMNGIALIKKHLGKKTAAWIACLMIFFLILWIGINGDILARLCIALFPSWVLPFSVTVVVMLLPVLWFSHRGFRSLSFYSRLFIAVILLLPLHGFFNSLIGGTGMAQLLAYVPQNSLEISKAVTMVAGNFALSTIMLTDICRFAKKRTSVFLCVSAYAIILFFCNLSGILIAQLTGARNLSYGIYLLDMALPGLLWLLLCSYTTQNVNMYVGSIALQELLQQTVMGGNISHSIAVYFIYSAAVIMGILKIDRYLTPFTRLLLPLVLLLTIIMGWKIRKRHLCR